MNLIAMVDIQLKFFGYNDLPCKKTLVHVLGKLDTIWAKVNQSNIVAQFAFEKTSINNE